MIQAIIDADHLATLHLRNLLVTVETATRSFRLRWTQQALEEADKQGRPTLGYAVRINYSLKYPPQHYEGGVELSPESDLQFRGNITELSIATREGYLDYDTYDEIVQGLGDASTQT